MGKKSAYYEAAEDLYVVDGLTLEATLARINGKGAPAGTPAPLAPLAGRQISTPQEAVAVLEEVLALKLNAMLVQPELLTLPGIKDVKQCLELIDNLKTKYRPGDQKGPAPGLSDAAAEQIRRMILGAA